MVNPLIDVSELATALASAAPPLVFDVRFPPASSGRAAYQEEHVPGAVFLDRDAVLAGPPGTTPGPTGGRHPLPDPAALQEALRDLGLTADHPVVVYDEGAPPVGSAARAWWILRWAGHPDVRLLDGGFAAWKNEGRPTETATVERPRGDFTVRPGSMPVLDAAGAAELARTGALLDARVAVRFRGEEEPLDPIAGRIPGAGNLPLGDVVRADGRFRPAAELRPKIEKLIGDADSVGTYCGSGITAAHTALAITAAGYETPALYVGSWSEWITDPNRPIAKGPAT
ncbi:sulfurtransferase [Virgisporangium aurantiacum]|uniref:Sulfurtransferase n=1 Tax=Virgisporangium aurantiacum TaxID=175570 RepID=A0A8J3YVU7_9ACTN|nr:sulfurtransferase [Virgisporangium aurantiacum]